jgi:hypothetical protein
MFLKDFFKLKLEQSGFGDELEIEYRFSYSQGDGVAFYGPLEEDSLVTLCNKLLSGTQKAAVKRAINKGVTFKIERNSFGYRYAHFNTMELGVCDYYAEELTEFEISAVETFEETLIEHIRATSKELQSNGYAIIEAGSEHFALENRKREFNTARFKLIIEEVEDNEMDWSDIESEHKLDLYDKLISGSMRYFCLKVSIESQDGLELSERYLGCCTADNTKQDLTYQGYLKGLVSDAITEARETIDSISLAA